MDLLCNFFISNKPSVTSSIANKSPKQSAEMCGIQVLRASIRDQDGKKYVFIISQTESWKVALGLQRLKRGSQVRAMGIAGMPLNEAKALIESLGWG